MAPQAPVKCYSCGREVPPGEFCGACGAHLVESGSVSARRRHAFAANPQQSVFHLSVVGTLFPHLPHRRVAPFQIALLVTVLVLGLLGLVGLIGPAIGLAAVAVPVLYLIYMYEVEIYQSEPWLVIGSTVAVGAVLGVLWAITVGPVLTTLQTQQSVAGRDAIGIVGGGIALPLAAQLLMLLGALLIYALRPRFDEALDGFAFGAASGLGFTLAVTLIEQVPRLNLGLFSLQPAIAGFADVITKGILVPVVNACTTGLLAGSLWLARGKVRSAYAHGLSTSIYSAIAVAVLAQAALGLVNVLWLGPEVAMLCYLVVAGVVLLWVRLALHHFLLAEAVEVAVGADQTCSHCGRLVPRMAFCPNCGVATRATPKVGAGRDDRRTR